MIKLVPGELSISDSLLSTYLGTWIQSTERSGWRSDEEYLWVLHDKEEPAQSLLSEGRTTWGACRFYQNCRYRGLVFAPR